MTVAKTTDGGKDRGIAFLKQKQHDRRSTMTAKLFEAMRVVFGSRDNTRYNQQMLCWAKTEYGTDWAWAYQHLAKTGKTPTKGIDY